MVKRKKKINDVNKKRTEGVANSSMNLLVQQRTIHINLEKEKNNSHG